MPLGIAIFAPFAVADGTLLEDYEIPTGGSFAPPGGGSDASMEVIDGVAVPLTDGANIVEVDDTAAVPLIVGSEVYVDVYHSPTLPTLTNAWVGFFFQGDGTTNRIFFEIYRLDPNRTQVVIRQAGVSSEQKIPSLTHQEGTWLRYGITIVSTTEVTLWTEPAGGGTRTERATWVPGADWLLPAHAYHGIAYSNVPDTDSRWDNFTVLADVAAVLPVAEFTHVADELEVTFTDASTSLETTIVGWAWDFGDGETSDEQHPVHVYAEDGTYTVRLTITDDEANEVFIEHDVTVAEAVVAPSGCFPTDYSCVTATDPAATQITASAVACTEVASNNVIVVDDSCIGVGVVEADEWILGDGSLLGETGLEIG